MIPFLRILTQSGKNVIPWTEMTTELVHENIVHVITLSQER